jgi:hypothetical protein
MTAPFPRVPVSAPQNVWFNGRTVDDTDLDLEQNFNNTIEGGIKQNHFGTGVLPDVLTPNILFNSSLTQGLLDGQALNVQAQPSDNINGNQLQITLSGSAAAGRRCVKILIVGLNFENNLQYDSFYFHRNETQISSKHYTNILTIVFNDFVGLEAQSFNLGGTIIISEATPMSLSRDAIMIAEDYQPNLFFRDFFVSTGGTINNLLTTALPNYNIGGLNITAGYLQLVSIVENDVSSQIGEKFIAYTNNIQKITLCMSVINDITPSNLVWSGDIIVSIYPLQTSVSCITDIVPQLAIDYDPSNIPLAQLSFAYNDLLNQGIELNTVPQPVDFIFSNTTVGSGLAIIPNNYYAITVKRAGSAGTCQIQFATGTNTSPYYRETLFNGNIWTDVPESSLWFQVWTDAAKVSDGQAYDNGNGIIIPKNQINTTTNTKVDYVLNNIQFTGNALYSALVQAITTQSVPLEDQRTGEPELSQQQFTPSVSLLDATGLLNIQNVSVPLIIGTITDQNVKAFGGNGTTLSASMHEYGMVQNQIVLKVVTNPSDPRYDQDIIELVSEVVGNTLYGAQYIPDTSNPSLFYRIVNAELITMIYGDVNGDGIVNEADILPAQAFLGTNLNIFPTYPQYIDNITPFVNDNHLTWQVVNPVGPVVIASGSDGIMTVNPSTTNQANFNSVSANFNSISNLGSYNLVISNSVISAGNNGSFTITNLIDNADITISKILYTSNTILQLMRADVNQDGIIGNDDITYITNYATNVPPFPATAYPATLVGTTFQAIRLTFEEYVDRFDDYPFNQVNRSTTLHPLPDLFIDGYYKDGYTEFAGQDVLTDPIPFNINKELTWYNFNIVVNSNPKLVPASFDFQTGYTLNPCSIQGVVDQYFPVQPAFDPGRNDIFFPNNIIMNYGGQLVTPSGNFYKVDFETCVITIEIPDGYFNGERSVNLFTDFVANFSGTGYTALGRPAMRFADCSFVSMNALILNQVLFSVSVQSFSPQINGLDPNCYSGIIVDGKIGVSIDYASGLLTLNFENLYQDPVEQTLNTKVEITVFLKRGGWNNQPIYIDSTTAQNILGVSNPTPSNVSCPGPSVVMLMSSSNPVAYNASLTLTAFVVYSGSPIPTGIIVFKVGNTTIGIAALNGSASTTLTINTTVLGSGTSDIVAYYPGDVNFGPGQSLALVQVVS